ncbi:sensor histidine kinase [Couchioplanes caeruleus]|uniref:sensor histidine kinase n=1 Tax=Couchioplanes caeruleus TaxID=56438 RepID=UPI0020C0F239|nr:sensor histidine kinase [Couchioplanes caeruleus]UQU66619.1 sensor histidine kinase [Couchioplanes caeruleus]
MTTAATPRRLMDEVLWDVFFAVVALGVAAAVAVQDAPGRVAGLASIAVIALLYAVWGRRLVRKQRQGIGYAVTVLAVFAAGAAGSDMVSYLLFGLCPMFFMLLDLRPALVAVVVANLTPLAVGFAANGFDASYLVHVGPVFVMTAGAAAWLGVWINRVVKQSTERAELIAELERSRAEVARLSHEAGVAAERARLAGEIHDTLAQGFTSIITLLQAADPALADERLALAVRTARENLAESRALVAALAPPALGDGSLLDAVRRQAARAAEDSGAASSFRTTGAARPLPTAVEVVLLRAAQEALTNVRRHAAARDVSVLLAYEAEKVRLVVRDDGRGFDPGQRHGFGLDGMRARAGQVGGTLTVRSEPGAGATIELEVPA